MPLPPRIVLLMGLSRRHIHPLKGALHTIRYGVQWFTGGVLLPCSDEDPGSSQREDGGSSGDHKGEMQVREERLRIAHLRS